jgi:tetratricopeptide (TPR) repeat protein
LQRKIALLFLFVALFMPHLFADPDEEILIKKSRIIMQKAQRAANEGNLEDAVAFYEEAYNTYPKNFFPLWLWGKSLYKVGMFERALEVLERINLDKVNEKGRSEILLMMGNIAVSLESLEEAASEYSKSVKVDKDNLKARVRLALVNQLMGMTSRAEELLFEYDSFEGLPFKETVLAMLVDIQLGNFLRALSTTAELGNYMTPENYVEEDVPFLLSIWKISPIALITFLPLSASGVYAVVYYFILFAILMFVAGRFSEQSALWHDILFLILGTGFMAGTQFLSNDAFFMAAMTDQFSGFDSVWIMPRLLISGHFLALGMLIIFPAFRLLPPEQRPRRYEYYGIWFFCWFFMIFVLTFQSRMAYGPRIAAIVLSALAALFTSLFVPLGRFIIFRIGNLLGFESFLDVNRKKMRGSIGISFTDAKILETRAWGLLENDDFDEVVLTARKVQSSLDKKNFPQLWKTMILALIARENYVDAKKSIDEFLEVFSNSRFIESGQLLKAYLKACLGDYASALKIIRAFSEDRVKSFSPNETAISLLVLGKCDLAYKDNVQAHIDINKAFTIARLPFIKAEALVEVIELDFNMKSKEMIGKLKNKVNEIGGGNKSQKLKKMILSIVEMSDDNSDKAIELAEDAFKLEGKSSRVCAWYGHLLCLAGKTNEAENLLEKMAPESADTARLMAEVTGS